METTQSHVSEVTDMVSAWREGGGGLELEARVNVDQVGVGMDDVARVVATCNAHHRKVGEADDLDIFTVDPKAPATRLRTTLRGGQAIRAYCEHQHAVAGTSTAAQAMTTVKKSLIRSTQEPEYGFRVTLSSEEHRELASPVRARSAVSMYRLKRRYSYLLGSTEPALFRLDITVVKTAKALGRAFRSISEARLQHREETVEVEVEMLPPGPEGSDLPADRDIAVDLLQQVSYVFELLTGGHRPMRRRDVEDAILAYAELVAPYNAKAASAAQTRNNADGSRGGGGGGGMPLDRATLLAVVRRSPKSMFAGPQPVALQGHNLVPNSVTNGSVLNDGEYMVTDKADGERALLFIAPGGAAYTINSRMVFRLVSRVAHDLPRTLVDGELLPDGRFMAFDAYFLSGDALVGRPLAERIDAMRRVMTALGELPDTPPHMRFSSKQFLNAASAGGEGEGARAILAGRLAYETDGLIFTPAGPLARRDGTVPLFGRWDANFKWKDARHNTVDFLVVRTASTVRRGRHFASFDLYVGQTRVPPVDALGVLRRRGLPDATSVIGGGGTGRGGGDVATAQYTASLFGTMDVELDGKRVARCDNGDVISDYYVVECRHIGPDGGGGGMSQAPPPPATAATASTRGWVPSRVRYDKTALYARTNRISNTANDYKTARNTLHTIMHPVRADDLTRGIPAPRIVYDSADYYLDTVPTRHSVIADMSAFHNRIVKGAWLFASFPESAVLDLACGRGGDLHKWKDARCRVVVGVDASVTNITGGRVISDGIYSRYMEMASKSAMHPHTWAFLPFDARHPIASPKGLVGGDPQFERLHAILWGLLPPQSDGGGGVDARLRPYIGIARSVDVVSCQFALHYFFDAPESLDTLLRNVAGSLRPGGVFVGTCLDGARVMERLKAGGGGDGGRRVVGRAHSPGLGQDVVAWSIEYHGRDGDGGGHQKGAADNKATAGDGGEREREEDNKDDMTHIGFGTRVSVFIDTINRPIMEHLVDFDVLVERAAAHGLRPMAAPEVARRMAFEVDSATPAMPMFGDIHAAAMRHQGGDGGGMNVPDLAPHEQEFSFMNRAFVFVRDGGVELASTIGAAAQS